MQEWMGDKEMEIRVSTDRRIGSTIIISGFHPIQFENRGVILKFENQSILSYSHLSSLSRLPDLPEIFSIITFLLNGAGHHTQLTVRIENFPTQSIYQHFHFYWQGTLIFFLILLKIKAAHPSGESFKAADQLLPVLFY